MASTENNTNNEFGHKHPHYHLRVNKAIDRLLFVDLIKAFNLFFNVREYKYIGFGGPYLEDFKLLSYTFPEMEMISIEADEETYKRQKFHKCSQKLQLMPETFKQFLDETEVFDKHSIIAWIDYTDNKIERFREIETFSKKTKANSLIRFTLNAKPLNMKAPIWVNKRRRRDIEQICSEYLPDRKVDQELFKNDTFSKIICELVEKAIIKGLDIDSRVFEPLHCVRYSDGTQMVSVTGVICEEKDSDRIAEGIKEECSYINDKVVDIIDIPSLTLKERFHIEACLPNTKKDGAAIAAKLGYMIGNDEEDNLRKCEQYEKYYPYYPYFNKIVP